jgi:hypothetical protein
LSELQPECKGCATLYEKGFGTDYCQLYYKGKVKDVNCPCFECLIKGVCEESCNNFKEFIEYIL